MSSRIDEIQRFIDGLDESELIPLYNIVNARLNLIQKAKELYALKDFHIFDRVFFHHGGQHIEAIIVRINLRTVSVIDDTGRRWTVSPNYIQKVQQPTANTSHGNTQNQSLATYTVKNNKPKPKKKRKKR